LKRPFKNFEDRRKPFFISFNSSAVKGIESKGVAPFGFKDDIESGLDFVRLDEFFGFLMAKSFFQGN
jgi:hypothetical protein